MTANECTRSTEKESSGTATTERQTEDVRNRGIDKKHAFDVAEQRLSDELEQIQKHLNDIQGRLRDGDNPTPEDLLMVQSSLHHSAEAIVDTLDDLTVEPEPDIITEIRELAFSSNGQMLWAAKKILCEEQLYSGPYQYGMADVGRAFAVMDLIDEYGAVAEEGESPTEIENVAALAQIIEVVDGTEDIEIVYKKDDLD